MKVVILNTLKPGIKTRFTEYFFNLVQTIRHKAFSNYQKNKSISQNELVAKDKEIESLKQTLEEHLMKSQMTAANTSDSQQSTGSVSSGISADFNKEEMANSFASCNKSTIDQDMSDRAIKLLNEVLKVFYFKLIF